MTLTRWEMILRTLEQVSIRRFTQVSVENCTTGEFLARPLVNKSLHLWIMLPITTSAGVSHCYV
jgi:hypothetical protein